MTRPGTTRILRSGPTKAALVERNQGQASRDQTISDGDQTRSDADQTATESDQASSDLDQHASDVDQATADREPGDGAGAGDHRAASRAARATGTEERREGQAVRAASLRDREIRANDRDRLAEARDRSAAERDSRAAALDLAGTESVPDLRARLEQLIAVAAADRIRAAADRERAAIDRADSSRERARLRVEIRLAHIDQLTGAYRREMGQVALSHEIARARRADGRFVLAYVDVDRLKAINDCDGHAAGDRVLKSLVDAIRGHVRSFDPIVRLGGDEFVCGLGGTDLAEVERRFDSIGEEVRASSQVQISVGLATLGKDDSIDGITKRADTAMLAIKAQHQARAAEPARRCT